MNCAQFHEPNVHYLLFTKPVSHRARDHCTVPKSVTFSEFRNLEGECGTVQSSTVHFSVGRFRDWNLDSGKRLRSTPLIGAF